MAPGDVAAPPPADALEARDAAAADEEQARLERRGWRQYPVTVVLTVACVALLALSYVAGGELQPLALYRMGAANGEAVRSGEVWRLLAAAFLHANPLHLIFNLWALWSFGPALETLLGRARYLLLYAAAALAGSLASALLGSGSAVGASGAIWGLMMAGVGVALRPRGLLGDSTVARLRKAHWRPVVVNLGYSFAPGISLLAHLGGGVAGFALAATVLTRGLTPLGERGEDGNIERWPHPTLRLLAVVAAVVMALSVAAALAVGRPWELGGAPALRRVAVGDTEASIELPAYAVGRQRVEQATEGVWVAYGSLRESPATFEVGVVRRTSELPASERDDYLERLRVRFDEGDPKDVIDKGKAARVPLPGKPSAIRIRHRFKNGVTMTVYAIPFARTVIFLRVYAPTGGEAAASDVDEKVAASVTAP